MREHEPCEKSDCQECCEHEFDWDEGYMCLNCGKQGDVGEAIDRAMDSRDD